MRLDTIPTPAPSVRESSDPRLPPDIEGVLRDVRSVARSFLPYGPGCRLTPGAVRSFLERAERSARRLGTIDEVLFVDAWALLATVEGGRC